MMTRVVVFSLFLSFGSIFLAHSQKSKVLATFQLIETEKYKEAKEAIEEAVEEESTKYWPRTWYARGLLAQKAYEKGKKENDKNKYQLYPDQLFVAYNSYEKALKLDNKKRLNDQLEPLYVLLANDFQKLGESQYKNKNYDEALKAFETALEIIEGTIVNAKLDPSLIYNAALSAYFAEEWDKAIEYLSRLNKEKYSHGIPHLLSEIYLEKNDTIAALDVLAEGIKKYDNNEELILLLAELHYESDDIESAVKVLNKASEKNPDKYIFPYTKGLIYQKNEQYKESIDAYEKALSKAGEEDEFKIYKNIGISWYNIGVGIQEEARKISNIRAFQREKEKATAAFKSAIDAFEKAHEENPDDLAVTTRLNQLYDILNMDERVTE